MTFFDVKSYFQIGEIFLKNKSRLPPPSFFKIMDTSETNNFSKNNSCFFGGDYFILASISLGALAAALFISNLNQDFQTKFLIFSAIIFAYLLFYALQKRKNFQREKEIAALIRNEEIENKLLALEEASTFFGASLKFPDMFRLVASRVNELIPFAACAFFLVEENSKKLNIVCAVGENSRDLLDLQIDSHKGLAGRTFIEQEIRHEAKLLFDKIVLPEQALKNFESGLAVPLFRGADVFGVLTLYGGDKKSFDENSIRLIEAVGTRIAPLFVSSMSFERSLTNALTDALTNLPNERAFYLVLENQIAESQRSRDERHLTILSIDIKDFTELNKNYGYAAGDQILTFAANLIKAQLRRMDFLSRSRNDEFLAVLPTASDEFTLEIIERIEKAFFYNKFEFLSGGKINLQLNFGAATFLKNGETAHQLLQYAQIKKQQSKSGAGNNVICFPKKYVNQC